MKIHHILSLAALLAMPVAAQELHTSYFMESSTTRHEMNPALLDKSYVTMPILPVGYFNIGTTGNVGFKNFVYKMEPGWQGYGMNNNNLTTFMHPSVSANEFLGGLKDNNRLSVNLKYQIFGMGFKSFGGISSVELNLRSNTNVALPKDLFEFMKTAGQKTDYNISDVGIRSENFAELGLGHSHKIGDKLTVGGKVKFLFGLGYADALAQNLKLHLSDDKWSVKGNIDMSASLMDSELEFEDDSKDDPKTHRHRVSGIDEIKGGLSGFGMAFDLGATYQVLPDLKVSAALTDLGFINWKNTHKATSAGEWEFDGFDNIYVSGDKGPDNKYEISNQFEDLGDDLGDMFAVYYDGKKSQSRALAATLTLGAEYTLPAYRKLKFGFLYSSRMAGRFSYHQGMFSANVAPLKWFEAALSMGFTSSGVTGGLVASLHAKHFNLTVGTDRFFGKLSKQFIPLNRANSNLTIGMSFPM